MRGLSLVPFSFHMGLMKEGLGVHLLTQRVGRPKPKSTADLFTDSRYFNTRKATTVCLDVQRKICNQKRLLNWTGGADVMFFWTTAAVDYKRDHLHIIMDHQRVKSSHHTS